MRDVAGAIYWAGIGRVRLRPEREESQSDDRRACENPTLDLPCRTVFAGGQRPVEVVGPLLEDEAAAPGAISSSRRSCWTRPTPASTKRGA